MHSWRQHPPCLPWAWGAGPIEGSSESNETRKVHAAGKAGYGAPSHREHEQWGLGFCGVIKDWRHRKWLKDIGNLLKKYSILVFVSEQDYKAQEPRRSLNRGWSPWTATISPGLHAGRNWEEEQQDAAVDPARKTSPAADPIELVNACQTKEPRHGDSGLRQSHRQWHSLEPGCKSARKAICWQPCFIFQSRVDFEAAKVGCAVLFRTHPFLWRGGPRLLWPISQQLGWPVQLLGWWAADALPGKDTGDWHGQAQERPAKRLGVLVIAAHAAAAGPIWDVWHAQRRRVCSGCQRWREVDWLEHAETQHEEADQEAGQQLEFDARLSNDGLRTSKGSSIGPVKTKEAKECRCGAKAFFWNRFCETELRQGEHPSRWQLRQLLTSSPRWQKQHPKLDHEQPKRRTLGNLHLKCQQHQEADPQELEADQDQQWRLLHHAKHQQLARRTIDCKYQLGAEYYQEQKVRRQELPESEGSIQEEPIRR